MLQHFAAGAVWGVDMLEERTGQAEPYTGGLAGVTSEGAVWRDASTRATC